MIVTTTSRLLQIVFSKCDEIVQYLLSVLWTSPNSLPLLSPCLMLFVDPLNWKSSFSIRMDRPNSTFRRLLIHYSKSWKSAIISFSQNRTYRFHFYNKYYFHNERSFRFYTHWQRTCFLLCYFPEFLFIPAACVSFSFST